MSDRNSWISEYIYCDECAKRAYFTLKKEGPKTHFECVLVKSILAGYDKNTHGFSFEFEELIKSLKMVICPGHTIDFVYWVEGKSPEVFRVEGSS